MSIMRDIKLARIGDSGGSSPSFLVAMMIICVGLIQMLACDGRGQNR